MDIDRMKASVRRIWTQGDYRPTAERFEPAAQALIEAVGIVPGQTVLDVAAGTGNVAVIAARCGGVVTASDLTPRMVELGRARTEAEGLDVTWVEADAEDLPFPEVSFDVVTSVFGSMFAPQPEVVAAEAARVLRPGGVFGMANWSADGYFGSMRALSARWWGRSPEAPDPMDWAVEEIVRRRLAAFSAVDCRRATLPWRFASAREAREFLERDFPTFVAAPAMLGAEAAAEMMDAIEALTQEAADADGRVDIAAEYLLVLARR